MIKMLFKNSISLVERRILMMYLLSCATGIRISDIRNLHWANIKLDCKNGVAEFRCQKTGRMNYVPLSPMACDVLCYATEGNIDYVEHERHVFVRVYSPTKINATLKLLAKKVGISKNITFHQRRH